VGIDHAAPLYPALLWIALRTARGKRTPAWAIGLVAPLLRPLRVSGDDGVRSVSAVAYFVYVAIRERLAPRVFVVAHWPLFSVVMIAARRSSLSRTRQTQRLSRIARQRRREHVFPLHQLRPLRQSRSLGNRALRDCARSRLGTLNNYIEARFTSASSHFR